MLAVVLYVGQLGGLLYVRIDGEGVVVVDAEDKDLGYFHVEDTHAARQSSRKRDGIVACVGDDIESPMPKPSQKFLYHTAKLV